MKEIKGEEIKKILRPRARDGHKGDYGKDLIVAGSHGMAGAAVMCGKACLKSGAGLVRFAAPVEIWTELQTAVPEATCVPRDVKRAKEKYSAMVIGPGLGEEKNDVRMMNCILETYEGGLVIDADGLNDIWRFGMEDQVKSSGASIIMTPHPGEAAGLLWGYSRKEGQRIEERENTAVRLAEKFGATVVLKGAGTIIADQRGGVYVNGTGNPGMATGGSGDILAGMIAGFLGQGYDTIDAVRAAVYIHGLAGDIAADRFGEISMTAMDILDCLPYAFMQMTR